MNKYAQAMQIIRGVREKTDTAILYYSAGGKDGIALLDMLAGVFNKVICYYMYLIPELDHIQPYIRWAEKHYNNVEVRQIPHFQRDIWLREGIFCIPQPDAPKPRKVGEVEEEVRQETGLHFAFSGMKGVDGYMKRMRLKMYGKKGYITDKGMVYPLANWTNKEVLQYINSRNLIKPFVYSEGEVSQGFVVSLPIMLLMKYRYPRDFDRILEHFPFANKLLFDFCDGIVPKGQEKALQAVLKSLNMAYLMPETIKVVADTASVAEADDTPQDNE